MTSFPVVNNNGDSVETLMSNYNAVMKQALTLRSALANAAPHGRNWQTVDVASYSRAQEEWITIAKQVEEIQLWAEHHLNELLRQAHQRMSSQQVGDLCMKVLR